ncbi:hypothetical protein Lesp01_57290 [Lentzea sp. NBRC 102530]|nr:hypothetical protein Lesp01_57290 [Lentzea sp. NBRC 102530]
MTQADLANGIAHYRLTEGTEDVVRGFLANDEDGETRSVSPLPGLPRYQRVLKVLHDEPDQSFTVAGLCDKTRRRDVAVRRSVQELHEAGYVVRDLPDQDTPGRPQFHYRLNPEAAEHASVLLLGAVEGA